MAATVDEMLVVQDAVEQPRVMDGNILREESWTSVSLATKMTFVYKDDGSFLEQRTEDI